MVSLNHRAPGYALIEGEGIEIGALHEPARLPQEVRVSYFDVIDERKASELFPEIPKERFVHVSVLGDLDNDGLAQFNSEQFDFVIITHVLEHLANPLKTLVEIFRVLRSGGIAIIAVPDKRFTFDRNRTVTTFEHLWSDYLCNVRTNDDSHYLDFLRSAEAHVFDEDPANLPIHINHCRRRREHAHVWTTETFKEHLLLALPLLGIKAQAVFESIPAENSFEYFAAWRKIRTLK